MSDFKLPREESSYIDRPDLEKLVGVLVERLEGHVKVSVVELEDAPDVEIRKLFETDEVEMRTVDRERSTLYKHVNTFESWNKGKKRAE